jgi:hypothetical protein
MMAFVNGKDTGTANLGSGLAEGDGLAGVELEAAGLCGVEEAGVGDGDEEEPEAAEGFAETDGEGLGEGVAGVGSCQVESNSLPSVAFHAI